MKVLFNVNYHNSAGPTIQPLDIVSETEKTIVIRRAADWYKKEPYDSRQLKRGFHLFATRDEALRAAITYNKQLVNDTQLLLSKRQLNLLQLQGELSELEAAVNAEGK